MFEREVPTKGRAAYQEWPNRKLVDIIEDSTWRKIELRGDSTKEYSGLILANTSNEFLVIEYSKSRVYPTGRTVEGDIVKMNFNGEVIEKIFDCEQGQLTGDLALSKNDSKLLFTLEQLHHNLRLLRIFRKSQERLLRELNSDLSQSTFLRNQNLKAQRS